MITMRPTDERGHIDHGWLDARHSFSFGRYVDRAHMGFGPLRVINEDRVAPGAGFATHPHENMEIITYVLEGALRHDDSTGGGGVLRRHDVQAMTAGAGITHSEKNASTTDALRLIQIWIMPREDGLPPAYADRRFDPGPAEGRLQTLASPDGRNGSLVINQDATLSRVFLDPGESVPLTIENGRRLWVQAVAGSADLAGAGVSAGDGAHSETPGEITLSAGEQGLEALIFDLP